MWYPEWDMKQKGKGNKETEKKKQKEIWLKFAF